MEREKIERDDSVLLVLRDEEHGAVTLEAWADSDDKPHGVLVLHYPRPLAGSSPGPCEFLAGGQCHSDQSFTVGHELAPDVLAGYDARALTELYQWFTERVGETG
jgi:hypothetical protein